MVAFAALARDPVLELPLHLVERSIGRREIPPLLAVLWGGMRDVQLVPRQADVDAEAVTIPVLMMANSLDHDVARGHSAEDAVESSGSIAKVGRESVRVIHASERELKR